MSLKSQLSRELRNVNKSRSGDDIRISEWEHWDSLQFLVPAITPGKSVDSIQVIESTSAKDSSHHTPEKISKIYDNKRKLKSTPLSENRLKALNSCVNILEKSVVSEDKNDEISYFCKNLDEKLKKMDYWQRILLEISFRQYVLSDTIYNIKFSSGHLTRDQ